MTAESGKFTENLFDVVVPDSELEAPAFEPIPTGTYRATLQAGAALAGNDNGWKAIRIPFAGFRDTKSGKEWNRSLNAQLTYENPSSPQSVKIGFDAIIQAAAALGLTEPVTGSDGKPGQKLTAANMDELVSQFNQMAGTEVEVYLTAGPRKRKGVVVLKQDGTPFIDNEIKRISAAR